MDATSKEIRDAGDRGVSDANALWEASYAAAPYARNHRRRDHDVSAYLDKVRAQKQGSEWVVEESDRYQSDSDQSSKLDGGGSSCFESSLSSDEESDNESR